VIYRGIKRLLDIVVSLGGMIFLSPLLITIGILIFVSMGRPITFRQQRPGLGGRPFRLLKFRTMRPHYSRNEDELESDRITPVGRVLRSTSLDELPELWNVLRGDMSLVGPRPLLMEYLPLYNARQTRRHDVKPGITGWAQINGRNQIGWQKKFELDVWYVENRSLALDLKILAITIGRVLSGAGVSPRDAEIMEKFSGNVAKRSKASRREPDIK